MSQRIETVESIVLITTWKARHPQQPTSLQNTARGWPRPPQAEYRIDENEEKVVDQGVNVIARTGEFVFICYVQELRGSVLEHNHFFYTWYMLL